MTPFIIAMGLGILTHDQIQTEREKAIGLAVDIDLVEVISNLNVGDKLSSTDFRRKTTRRFKSNKTQEVKWDVKDSLAGRVLNTSLSPGDILEWGDLKEK